MNEDVTRLIKELDPNRIDLLAELRKVVLASSSDIVEHIKWNSPAYRYEGELLIDDPKKYTRDLLVLNLRSPKYVLLIFPSGMHVNGVSPLLTGDYADGRRMVTIATQEELVKSGKEITKIIDAWIKAVKP